MTWVKAPSGLVVTSASLRRIAETIFFAIASGGVNAHFSKFAAF